MSSHKSPAPISALSDEDVADAAAPLVAMPRGKSGGAAGWKRRTVVCLPALPADEGKPGNDPSAGSEETRAQMRNQMLKTLRQACNCGKSRARRQQQQPGIKRTPRMHCTEMLLQSHLEECVDQRVAFMQMHKVDQDRLLFTMLKTDGGSAPQAADGGNGPQAGPQTPRIYQIFGTRVCLKTFMRVWGVGSSRLSKLRFAASCGDPGPPQDCRYLKQSCARDSSKLALITTFLR